jgi:hypothetical protein
MRDPLDLPLNAPHKLTLFFEISHKLIQTASIGLGFLVGVSPGGSYPDRR